MPREIDYDELTRMLAIRNAEDMTVDDVAELLFDEYYKQKSREYLLNKFIKVFGERMLPKKKFNKK